MISPTRFSQLMSFCYYVEVAIRGKYSKKRPWCSDFSLRFLTVILRIEISEGLLFGIFHSLSFHLELCFHQTSSLNKGKQN